MPNIDDATVTLATRLGATAAVATVVARETLSSSLVEVTLAVDPRLGGAPGSDVMVDVGRGRTLRRRYSVRRVDPDASTITLWVGVDHEGPGVDWVRAVAPGDEVVAIGPRGKIALDATATWHLFCGDLSALAALSRMVEALAPGQRALVALEVDEMDDARSPAPPEGVGLRLVVSERAGRAPSDPEGLSRALATLELPPGPGHAYLFGEFHVVRALRASLSDRGLDESAMSHKAYWRAGRANADHGEPDKSEPA